MMPLNQFIQTLFAPFPQTGATLFLLFFAAFGVGCLLPLRLRRHEYLARWVLGFDLLALFFLLAGDALFALPAAVTWILLAPPALYGVWKFRPAWRKHWLFALLLAAGGVWTLGSALVPPYAWDEQVYQVALPLRYLREGSQAMALDNSYSGFPSMPHLVMATGIRLGGLALPRLLVWASYLLLAAGFYRELRRFGGGTAAAVTAGVLLAPVTAAMNRECYMESFIAVNLFAGCAVLADRGSPRRTALLAGLAAGMAAAVKLTGAGTSLAIFILFARRFLVPCAGRERWSRFGWFALAAAVAGLPFYGRALLATGNPFYPFGSAWLAPGSGGAAVELYQTRLAEHLYGFESWWSPAVAWLFAGFFENLFDGIVLGWQFPFAIVVAVTGLFLLRFRNRKRLAPFLYPAAALLALYLFWCWSAQQTRFLLPGLFAACWLFAALLPVFRRRTRLVLLAAFLVLTGYSVFWPALRHYHLAWKMLPETRENPVKFLGHASRDPEYFTMLDHLSKNTPGGSRVLLLFERRGLYVPRSYRIATPHFQEEFFTPVPDTPEAVLKVLHDSGANYLLVGGSNRNPDELEVYNPENTKLAQHLIQLLRAGSLRLVEVPGSGAYNLLQIR